MRYKLFLECKLKSFEVENILGKATTISGHAIY
jgi:hypothetical protein